MIYITRQIKGKGRGKALGYPTINLEIPKNFHSKEGVYAGWLTIGHNKYKAAFHFGSIPTFDEPKPQLEAFLMDVLSDHLEAFYTKPISFDLVSYIRPVIKFDSPKNLARQIEKDVEQITESLFQ